MGVCFNLNTRLGPGDLFAPRWEHIDFDTGTVQIYKNKKKSSQTVPVTMAFPGRLRDMRARSKSGFIIEYRGKPVVTFRKSFNPACDLAGIKVPVRMYDFGTSS